MNVAFTSKDCEVFSKHQQSVSWHQVSPEDQETFKSVRARIKTLGNALAAGSKSLLPLKSETSHPSPNGRSPKELWCCVYPMVAQNKSYSLQITLIVSSRGAELCFCFGAGKAQVGNPEKAQELASILEKTRERLRSVEPSVIQEVQSRLTPKWFYRESWLSEPGKSEFSNLSDWLAYASTSDGAQASISRYLTPNELEELGEDIYQAYDEVLTNFEPILKVAYPPEKKKGFWIFQSNPKYFDVDQYLRSESEITWQLRQGANKVKPGDQVMIWRAGSNAGVIAECEVVSEAMTSLPDASHLFLTSQEDSKSIPKCRLKILKRYIDQPISRERIKGVLPELSIIRGPQGANYQITQDEYRIILRLKEDFPDSSFIALLKRYQAEQIVFISSKKYCRYAVAACDETGATIQRLDAYDPQRVTFAQAERLLARVRESGKLHFSSLDNTSAIRNTVLQAEPVALTADQKNIQFFENRSACLENFLQVIEGMKRANLHYKPVMLLAVLDGYEEGEITDNRIPFDTVAPRFIEKMASLGIDVTEREAAQPFYHLSGDLFWMHAVRDVKDLMKDGGDGPTAARTKIKYALLKDTYWNLLQDADSRMKIRQKLEELIDSSVKQQTMLEIAAPDLLVSAAQAIANTKFVFCQDVLQRFIASLAAKPFVILTGNSGTGKTKLAELFAQWLSDGEESRCALVPVGADWTDNRNVLGFVNYIREAEILENAQRVKRPVYQSTKILDLLLAAVRQPSKPHFLILDEMNLSHVERYFADFLSAMESNDGGLLLHRHGEDCMLPRAQDTTGVVPQTLCLPRNVFVIGTVNVDETTYMFSPKVLDRANVIEFRIAEDAPSAFLAAGGQRVSEIAFAPPGYPESFLKLSIRARGDDQADLLSLAVEPNNIPGAAQSGHAQCRAAITDLFSMMQNRHQEFAFRTMAEILRFLAVDYEFITSGTTWNWRAAMDAQILQKILPKLHGSRKRIEPLLLDIARYCETGKRHSETATYQSRFEQQPINRIPKPSSQQPDQVFAADPVHYRLSYEKVCDMIDSVRLDQFVSFIR